MTPEQIGQTIKHRRKQLHITQAKLALLAECSVPSVIAAEQGKATLRLDVLLAIVRVLGLTLTVG